MRCKLQGKCLLYVFVCCSSRNSIERGELLNKPVMLPRPHVTPVFGTSGTLVPTRWQEASKQLIELHFSVKQVSSVLHNTPPTGPAPDPANLNSSRSGSRDRYRVTWYSRACHVTSSRSLEVWGLGGPIWEELHQVSLRQAACSLVPGSGGTGNRICLNRNPSCWGLCKVFSIKNPGNRSNCVGLHWTFPVSLLLSSPCLAADKNSSSEAVPSKGVYIIN